MFTNINVMYMSTLQQNSSDGSGVQCLIFLGILVIGWIVLGSLNAKSKRATPYTQTIVTYLPREEVVSQIEKIFPKSIISSSFNWKSTWSTPDRLTATGYYLTNGQGCLFLLLTGILPGYFLIKLTMRRNEEVTVDFSRFEETRALTLQALGLRAQEIVNRLVDKLEDAEETGQEAIQDSRPLLPEQTAQPNQQLRTDEKTSKKTSQTPGKKGKVEVDPLKLKKFMEEAKADQNLPGGFIAGVIAAVIGAVIWANISVAIDYQIGWMAIGVGFLVGFAVGLFGKGVDKIFGIVGAILALFGCVGGNVLSYAMIISQQEAMPVSEVLSILMTSPAILVEVMAATFHPIDLLFYGLAIYQGYKFSFRRLSDAELAGMGKHVSSQPSTKIRVDEKTSPEVAQTLETTTPLALASQAPTAEQVSQEITQEPVKPEQSKEYSAPIDNRQNCPACGQSNPATNRYCIACGTHLTAGEESTKPPAAPIPVATVAAPAPAGMPASARQWSVRSLTSTEWAGAGLGLLVVGAIGIIFLTWLLSGSGSPDESVLSTRVAATVYAEQTAQVQAFTPTPTETPTPTPSPTGTPTPMPTDTPAPTPTAKNQAGDTFTPSKTSTPTSTPTPTTTSVPAVNIVSDTANLRTGPGTNYPVVGESRQGDTLPLTGRNATADWWQISDTGGQTAWINADLVEVVNAEDVPEVAAPSPPATPTPDQQWVLVADSAAEYPGPIQDRKWWYLWSNGRNNFIWEDMAETPDCYRSPNERNLAICRDQMTVDPRGDAALLWKAREGGTYRFEWDSTEMRGDTTLRFYKHLDYVGSQTPGTELPYSATIEGVIQWELFFWVPQYDTHYQVKVYKLQ